MKFTIESQTIKSVMQRMAAVTESRTTIPILNNVKIEASDKVTFVATDLDIMIKESVTTNVTEQGSITAPAQTLKDVVSKLDDGQLVTFNLKDGILHVTSGKSKFKLNTLPADDFPVLATDQFQATLPFQGKDLKRAIDRTVWAASTDSTRYYLQGIALQSVEGNATLITTDGHRLAKFTTECTVDFPSIIIPTKTAKQFSSILIDDVVALHVSETKVKLVSGGVEILSKNIEGSYPSWQNIIPKESNQSVTASSTDLTRAVERVQVVMSDRTKIVGISISDSELSLYASSGSGGDATDSIEAITNGANITVGLNGKYALDAMKQAEKGSVTISYSDSGSPLVISYEKEPELMVIVMPARL